MTITATISKIVYAADGVQTVFSFPFRVDDFDDMEVFIDEDIQASGYIINGIGDEAGGNVTFAVAPGDLTTVTLNRVVSLDQLADYVPFDKFPAESHELALDKLTMITQQLQEQLTRTVQVGQGDDLTVDYTMPPYDAGKGWMWSESDPKGIVNTDNNLNQIVSDATAQAIAAANSAASAFASEGNADASATEAAASAQKVRFWDISLNLADAVPPNSNFYARVARPNGLNWIFDTPCLGFCVSDPSSEVVITVSARNPGDGVLQELGTLTFATASNTGVWLATAAADQLIGYESMVRIETPADLFGMGDLIITVPLEIV